MARPPFDRVQARSYLESHGISTSNIRTDAYLQRQYRAALKAEAAGQTPSKKAARGYHPQERPVAVRRIEEVPPEPRRKTPSQTIPVRFLPAKRGYRAGYYIKRPRVWEEWAATARDLGDTPALVQLQLPHEAFAHLLKKFDASVAGPRRDYALIVHGWVKRYPSWSPSASNPLREGTFQVRENRLSAWDYALTGQETNILDYLNEAFSPGGSGSIEWVDVSSILIPLE